MVSNGKVKMNWKQYGKKQSHLNLRHYLGQVGVRKLTKSISHNSMCPDWDYDLGAPKHKAGNGNNSTKIFSTIYSKYTTCMSKMYMKNPNCIY